ncbi:MAG TPA: darcynin family protein [Bradyrhizobium sp.]|nr:darcynin family protein [Bradyrhizobium sp.]
MTTSHVITSQSAPAHVLPEHEDNPDTFHIFVLLKTTRHWLDMPTEKRVDFLDKQIRPLLRQCPEVTIRWFEPEAFAARTTDIMLCETKDLASWAWLCDHLRDTPFWDHYFEVIEVFPSIEGNYLV